MAALTAAYARYRTSKGLDSVNTKFDEAFYLYLDELRESGVTNMYGAGDYLAEEFPDLSNSAADEVLLDWMKTFGDRHPNGN